jgi:uracil-DNA glycosylase family 4
MEIEVLAAKMRACRKCAEQLSKYDVEPRPIFGGRAGLPITLIGQAPGRTEYQRNAPFQGDSGESIRALFKSCGLTDFDSNVYQTSVTKCFPGRRLGSSTDRMPSVSEVENCLPFLERQLGLLRPQLMVCLGSLSWQAYVRIRERTDVGYCQREFGKGRPKELRVPDLVGRSFEWANTVVLPMIHPAGSANGFRAQYPEQDRESKRLLREQVARLRRALL